MALRPQAEKSNTVEFAYFSTSGGLQKSADIRELPMYTNHCKSFRKCALIQYSVALFSQLFRIISYNMKSA